MRPKIPLCRWLYLAASLCAASNMVHAAPQATFTDSWKDTAVPISTVVPSTAGSFSFSATSLALDGELTTSELDSNSVFSFSIGQPGNAMQIFSETLGQAEKLSLGKTGSATFESQHGSLKLSWTATTMTVTGSTTQDALGEEATFAMNSDGIPADNSVDMLTTNEVIVTLDASDNGGGTFNEDTNVTGTIKNTETEHSNSDGTTFPLETGSLSGAGHGITFSDSWKDTAVSETQDAASTAAAFTFSATLPLDGELTTSELDSNSMFSLTINTEVGNVQIVSDTLGDALKFKLGTNGSATFPILVMDPVSGNSTSNGLVTVTWKAASLTVSGTASADVLGEEAAFAMSSDGTPADNSVNMGATNEVIVTLDASDNGGGTFNEDTNVIGTLKNAETEYTNPDGTTFPLETGSISGSGSGISFSETWKDTAAPAGYQASTSGSASINISLPLDGEIDTSEISTNSQFGLSIGPSGNPTSIISVSLAQANKFTAGKSGSATFKSQSGAKSLTLSWTPTTIMVVASASVDVLGEEAIFAMNSDGIPADNTGPISGLYEISMSLDSFAYDNTNVPVSGKNTETEQNSDGMTFPLETGTITGTADVVPPTVAITSPKANFAVYNQDSIIPLAGTAKDNVDVASVLYYVNGDTNDPPNEVDQDNDGDLPTNSIAWTASVDFSQVPGGRIGTNVVTVYAIDTSGNVSTLVSRAFAWIQTNSALVTVSPAGAGTIKGLKNGQLLYVGDNYSVTATPASKSWIFSQWTDDQGDILSSSANFEYSNTNDGSLTANFVPNPFTNSDLAGTYTALYFDTNDETVVRDDGYITITVTQTGAFTGKIYNADYSKTTGSLAGQFSESPDGSYATATPPLVLFGKSDYLQVSLQIATDPVLTDPGAGLLTGFVNSFSGSTLTNETDSAEIQGELSFYNTNILAGVYNIFIGPVSGDPSQGPGGYSYGTATVSNKKGTAGTVTLVLNLADGTSPAISFSTALANDGSCPIYTALYGGNAVLLGWMQFATDGSGTMSPATLTWFTESYDPTLLPRDTVFSGQPFVSGGLYTAPKAGANIFGEGATALTFTIDQGYSSLSLPDEIDVPVTYNPAKNTFTYTDNTDKATISLTTATGALTGGFLPAGSKSTFTYKGVVVDGTGYGFYTDPVNKETGPIVLMPADSVGAADVVPK